jgi:predicted RNA-binding protein associated with RNAse of E/G family
MSQIKVIKLDISGRLVWQYEGKLLRRRPHSLTLGAFFDVGDVRVADVVLRKGDRFVETFYDERMYNVFQVCDALSGKLKGWYCNVSRPAVLTADSVSWVDLALDLWVSPDGSQAVLDREEFEALDIEANERELALSALAALQRRFRRMRPRHE